MANIFEGEITKSLELLGWWHQKLAVPFTPGKEFVLKPPFDFLAMSQACEYGLEAKSKLLPQSFPFTEVKDHQERGLLDFKERMGRKAFVLINFRKPKKQAYAIDINDWVSLRLSSTRKSIPRERFQEAPFIEIPRIHVIHNEKKTLIWDFRILEN